MNVYTKDIKQTLFKHNLALYETNISSNIQRLKFISEYKRKDQDHFKHRIPHI